MERKEWRLVDLGIGDLNEALAAGSAVSVAIARGEASTTFIFTSAKETCYNEWLLRKSSLRFQERVPSGCKVGFATEKYKKLVRIGVAVEPATHEIKDVMIAGDEYVSPYTALDDMENELKGVDARNEQEQLERIKRILLRPDVEQTDFHKIEPEEFLSALKKAIDSAA